MGGVSKRLSSISLSSITGKLKKKPKNQTLVLDCSGSSSTESLLSQLEQAQHESITHITFKDSLQHHYSVQFYSALGEIINSKHCQLKEVRLIEPSVKAAEYRRWSFKRTNFLRHVYQDCQAKDIRVNIHATLLLETPENKLQDVSTWLSTHFPKTIPQDRDIKSIWISVRDVKPDGRCVVGDAVRVFQGLIDVFNNDNRRWDLIHCRVLYPTAVVPKYAVPQTEALVEVAEGYDIPMIVKWEPMDDTLKKEGTWIKASRQAASRAPSLLFFSSSSPPTKKPKVLPSNPPRGGGGKPLEDNTASTVEYEGSSEALAGIGF